MSRFSIYDESFDDLDNTLDKALLNASQTIGNNANLDGSIQLGLASRNSSQGSGIPLASLRAGHNDGRKKLSIDTDDENLGFSRRYSAHSDNTPLIGGVSSYRLFNSSSPLNFPGTLQFCRLLKRILS